MDIITNKTITIFLPRLHNNIRPLIDGLIELKFEVSVLTLRQRAIENHSHVNYVLLNKFSFFSKKYFMSSELKKYELPSLVQIYKHFKINKPNYLLIRNDTSFAYVVILILGKFYKSKIVVYNQYPINNPTIFQSIYNKLFFYVLRIRTVTPVLNKTKLIDQPKHKESPFEYKKRLEFELEHYSKRGVIWLPFASSLSSKDRQIMRKNRIQVLSIGKIQPRKNLDKVIFNLSEYANKYKVQISLRIIGENYNDKSKYLDFLEELIAKSINSYFDAEIFINFTRDDVDTFYENTDIFVLLSEKEVASVSQVEAFISGCKILIYFENGNLDFLPMSENYQILPSFDSFEEYFSKILKVESGFALFEYSTAYLSSCSALRGAERLVMVFETNKLGHINSIW